MSLVRAVVTNTVGVVAGEVRDETDPLVAAHPEWFEPAEQAGPTPDADRNVPSAKADAPVERATAAPGEKRSTRRTPSA